LALSLPDDTVACIALKRISSSKITEVFRMRTPLDPEAVAELMRTRAGWLMPDGSLLPASGIMEHMSALAGTAYQSFLDTFDKEMEEVWAQIHADQEEHTESHFEWHNYDGMREEPKEKLVRDLYSAGLIRLGYHVDKDRWRESRRPELPAFMAVPENNILEAEGLAEHVDAHSRRLQLLASKLMCGFSASRYSIEFRKVSTSEGAHLVRLFEPAPDAAPGP
jgi:hypothetical protein